MCVSRYFVHSVSTRILVVRYSCYYVYSWSYGSDLVFFCFSQILYYLDFSSTWIVSRQTQICTLIESAIYLFHLMRIGCHFLWYVNTRISTTKAATVSWLLAIFDERKNRKALPMLSLPRLLCEHAALVAHSLGFYSWAFVTSSTALQSNGSLSRSSQTRRWRHH